MVTLESFRFAAKGLKLVLARERNARIHLVFAVLALLLSWFLHISLLELGLVVMAITLVFFAEVVNTAIEKTLDQISTENNQIVKIVKDMTAAGVLLCAISAVVIAGLVFLPHIISLLNK